MDGARRGVWSPPARLALFAALSLLFSWSYWLIVLAGQRGWLSFQVPIGPAGSFGPALAAVATAALTAGRAGLGDLLRPLLRWRVHWGLYAAALLGMAGVLGATVLVQAARGIAPPPLASLDRWYLLPAVALLILIAGGPLGEEIGWRGFALPRLLETTSPFVASVALAALWFVWHLPLFWLRGTSQEETPLGIFAATILCYALVFTALHLRSGGSVLLAVLLHTGINTAWFVLPAALPGALDQPGFGSVFLAISALVAAAVVAACGRRFFRPGSAAAR